MIGKNMMTWGLQVLVSVSSGAILATPAPVVEEVQIAGTAAGCEPQSIGSASWDRTVQFETPSFDTHLGGGERYSRANCQLTAVIKAPQGWTYAVEEVKATGWAHIGPRVDARSTISYYFQGDSRTEIADEELPSWFRGEYQIHSKPRTPLWAPCGATRALNINRSLWLKQAGSQDNGWAYLKANTAVQVVLKWKQCY